MRGRYHDLFAPHLRVVAYTSRSLTAVCPFHQETDGSLSVDTHRGLYYCFGCRASGNYKGFVKALKVSELPVPIPNLATTAHRLRRLADELDHGPPPSLEPNPIVWMSEEGNALWGKRNVSPSTCQDLTLGFDPMVGALTIPVDGWVVRRMLGKDAKPRYRYPKGYPRSTVFVGEDWPLRSTWRANGIVLVEGPIDAVCAWQSLGGTAAVWAMGGSSLGEGQIDALRSGRTPVVLCLDGDDPGRTATVQITAKLMEAKVPMPPPVKLPEGQDPGSMNQKELRKLIQEKLQRAPR